MGAIKSTNNIISDEFSTIKVGEHLCREQKVFFNSAFLTVLSPLASIIQIASGDSTTNFGGTRYLNRQEITRADRRANASKLYVNRIWYIGE